MTGYIQTNLMSMTDGHIYFDSDIYYQGKRPAINIFLSVTRVGKQTHPPLLRSIADHIFRLMNKYADAQRFLRFGPELSEEIKQTLKRGDALQALFTQIGFKPMPIALQVLLCSFIWNNQENETKIKKIIQQYADDASFKKTVDKWVSSAKTFEELNMTTKNENY